MPTKVTITGLRQSEVVMAALRGGALNQLDIPMCFIK